MLELQDITRSFKKGSLVTTVLKNLSLTAAPGELISITGGSGSGKTTFMNIVGLLDKPTSGSYRIDGRDISASKPHELAALRNRLIGFVFQSFFLLPRLSVWRNVALPLTYRHVSQATSRQSAHNMLDRVGLANKADHLPNELSGGQRQRVAIARALVGNPRIVLADEPTGSLDVKTSGDVMELFKTIHEEFGVLVMIITHDPHIAQQCPRRIVLRDGRLVADEF